MSPRIASHSPSPRTHQCWSSTPKFFTVSPRTPAFFFDEKRHHVLPAQRVSAGPNSSLIFPFYFGLVFFFIIWREILSPHTLIHYVCSQITFAPPTCSWKRENYISSDIFIDVHFLCMLVLVGLALSIYTIYILEVEITYPQVQVTRVKMVSNLFLGKYVCVARPRAR